MADDMNEEYNYPFELPSEEEVRFGGGEIKGRPAGARLQHLQQADANIRRSDIRTSDHDAAAA